MDIDFQGKVWYTFFVSIITKGGAFLCFQNLCITNPSSIFTLDVKHRVLSVPLETLECEGAVSSAVVEAMAVGVRHITGSDCAIATSGIAGPGGGSIEKPVGTVWLAVDVRGNVSTFLLKLKDEGRERNICASAKKVLSLLLEKVSNLSV